MNVAAGQIEISELILRETALRDCGVPLTVRWGKVSKVSIELSWKQPFSSPFKVRVDRIHLVLGNPSDILLDDEAVLRYALLVKRRLVDRFYKESSGLNPEELAKQRAFVFGLLQNCDLTIASIHARFEHHNSGVENYDSSTTLNRLIKGTSAGGIIVTTIQFGSVQSDGQRSTNNLPQRPASACPPEQRDIWDITKSLSFQNCTCYWQCDSDIPIRDRTSQSDQGACTLRAYYDNVFSTFTVEPGHVILADTSASGELHMSNHKTDNQLDLTLRLNFMPASISISAQQYISLAKFWKIHSQSPFKSTVSRGLRPVARVMEAPREWWLYALDTIITSKETEYTSNSNERLPPWNWLRMKRWCKIRREYIRAYSAYLTGDCDLSAIDAFDQQLAVNDIILFRKIANLVRDKCVHTSKRSFLEQAFRWARRINLGKTLSDTREGFLEQITQHRLINEGINIGDLNLQVSISSLRLALEDSTIITAKMDSCHASQPAIAVILTSLNASYQHLVSLESVVRKFECGSAEIQVPSRCSSSDLSISKRNSELPFIHIELTSKVTNEAAYQRQQLQVAADIQPIHINMSAQELMAVSRFFSQSDEIDGKMTATRKNYNMLQTSNSSVSMLEVRASVCLPSLTILQIDDFTSKSMSYTSINRNQACVSLTIIPGVLEVSSLPLSSATQTHEGEWTKVPTEFQSDTILTGAELDCHKIELCNASVSLQSKAATVNESCLNQEESLSVLQASTSKCIMRRYHRKDVNQAYLSISAKVPSLTFGVGLSAPALSALWMTIDSPVQQSRSAESDSHRMPPFVIQQMSHFEKIILNASFDEVSFALPKPKSNHGFELAVVGEQLNLQIRSVRPIDASKSSTLNYTLALLELRLLQKNMSKENTPNYDLVKVRNIAASRCDIDYEAKYRKPPRYTAFNISCVNDIDSLVKAPDVTINGTITSVNAYLDDESLKLMSDCIKKLEGAFGLAKRRDLVTTTEPLIEGHTIDRDAVEPKSPTVDSVDSSLSTGGDNVKRSLKDMFLPHSKNMTTFQMDLSIGELVFTYAFQRKISASFSRGHVLVMEAATLSLNSFGNPYDSCELYTSSTVQNLTAWIDIMKTGKDTTARSLLEMYTSPSAPAFKGGASGSYDPMRKCIFEGRGNIDGHSFLELSITLKRNHILVDTTVPGVNVYQVCAEVVPTNVWTHMDTVDELLIEFANAEEACKVLNENTAYSDKCMQCITWAPSTSSSVVLNIESLEGILDPGSTGALLYLSSSVTSLQSSLYEQHRNIHVASEVIEASYPEVTTSNKSTTEQLQSRFSSLGGYPLKCMAGSHDNDSINMNESDQSLLFQGPITCYIMELAICKASMILAPTVSNKCLRSRSVAGSMGVKAKFVKQDDAQHSRINVIGLQMDSFDGGKVEVDQVCPPLVCMSPCDLFATRKLVKNETVSCALEAESISVTVAHSDVVAVMNWFNAVQKTVSADVSGYRWDQSTSTIVAKDPEARSRFSQTVNGQYVNEQGIVGVKYINVTFVNHVRRGYRPVALVSASLDADMRNWSSSLNGHAELTLAAALTDVKRSAWEPFLLANPDANDQITPWSLQLQAVTPPSDWIESSAFAVVRPQSNRKSKKTAPFLLDDDESTFWDGGAAKGDNWVLFEFHRVITLHRFRYYPRDSTVTGSNVPMLNVLEVGESRHGPFQHVIDFQGALGSKEVRSPAFSATGKFWKWTVKTRYGTSPAPAHVTKVEFAQRAGGTMIEISSEQASELTISTEALLRFQDIMLDWTRFRSSGNNSTASSSDSANSHFLGSHKLINMTGKPIAVMKGAIFSPAGAKEIADKSSIFFEFGDRSAGTDLSSVYTNDKRNPITHLDIIDIGAGEKAPRGWVTLKKDINRGRADCTQFFIYKRDMDSPPITDIFLRYADSAGSLHPLEPVPVGFEEILRDVNGRRGHGTRPMHVCFRRGCGAPLIDIALAYVNDNESLPQSFVAIPRLVNTGYPESFPVQIGYKRHAAEYTIKFNSVPKFDEQDVGHGGLKGSEIMARLMSKSKKKVESKIGKNENDSTSGFITGIAVYSSSRSDSRRGGILSGKGIWESKYRRQEKIEITDGQANPTYILYTREAKFPAITSLRISKAISSSKSQPSTEASAKVDSTMKSSTHGEEVQADGWIRVLPALNVGNTTKQPLMWLEFRRDVGASPIESIDFIHAESESVPEGFMMLDASLSMAANKGRIFKKRDIRLVFRLGEPPRMSFKLVTDDQSYRRSTVLLDSGITRIGPVGDGSNKTRRQKDVVVETNVFLHKSARPTITAAATPSQHNAEFNFTCKVINAHSFTISCFRTDRPHGWQHDLHVRWTIMGDTIVEVTDTESRSRASSIEGRASMSRRSRSLSGETARPRLPSASRTSSMQNPETDSTYNQDGAANARDGSQSIQDLPAAGAFRSRGASLGSRPEKSSTEREQTLAKGKTAASIINQTTRQIHPASPAALEPFESSPAVAKLLAIELLTRSRFKVPQISFEVRGWYPVSHIEVYQESVRTIVLSPKWHGLRKARVSISIEMVDEIRVITISSPLILRNNLDMKMNICYQQSLHDESILTTLNVGATFALPLGIMDKNPDSEGYIPLWRFWSEEQKSPFYTTNPMDVEYLGTTDWIQQGALGYIYRNKVADTIPLWVRQPMDYLDSLPAVTTNRMGYELDKKISPKPDHVMVTEGYRIAGYVYADQQPNCNPLHAYWNTTDKYLLFTIDSHEVVQSGNSKSNIEEGCWNACGVECYLPVHHGMLRIMPADESGHGHKWRWSKEILHLHRNQSLPSRSLLCASQQSFQYRSFECFIRSRLNSTEWILDSPIYLVNSLPSEIYIALTSSPDEPPGSNCIPIRPGEQYKTYPVATHHLSSSDVDSLSYSAEYNMLETAKRGTFLWVSLAAITRRVIRQGVTEIGRLFTRREDERGPEVAPIKAIELKLDTELDKNLITSGSVNVDVRSHRWSGEGTFEFNTTIIAPDRIAVQVVRTDTDSLNGWQDILFIAWEVWIDLQMVDAKTHRSPQVALRNWSQPTKLVWDDTITSRDDIQIEFTGSPGVPKDMQLGVHTAKTNYGIPTLYTVFSKYQISNMTGTKIQIPDDGGQNSLWHAEQSDMSVTSSVGLFSSCRSEGMVLQMVLSRKQLVDFGFHTRELQSADGNFELRSSALLLNDFTGTQEAILQLVTGTDSNDMKDQHLLHPPVKLSIQWCWGSTEKLWKNVTIHPPVVVYNQLPDSTVTLSYVAVDELLKSNSVPTVKAKVHASSNLPVIMNAASRRWFIRLDDTDWSCSFPLDEPSVQGLTVKLCDSDGSLIALNLKIEQNFSRTILTISESKIPPYRIENHCSSAIIMFHQEPSNDDGPNHFPERYLLHPGLAMAYAFDRCHKKNHFRVSIEDAFIIGQHRDSTGMLVDPSMDAPQEVEYAFLSEGETRKLHVLIFDQDGIRIVIFSDSLAKSRRLFGLTETIPSEHLSSELSIILPRIGLSIVDSSPSCWPTTSSYESDRLSSTRELFYICITGILINLCTTSEYVKRHLTIADIVVNHQINGAQHHVILGQPTEDDADSQPLIQLARITRLPQLGYGRGFSSESLIAVGIQTVVVNVDAAFVQSYQRVVSLYRMSKSKVFNIIDKPEGILHSWWRTQQYVFDQVKIYPVEVLLTTSFEDLESLDTSIGSKGLLFKVLTAMVGKVHELPFKFIGLELESLTITPFILGLQTYNHLWVQAMNFMSIHGLLTGTNVLGSLELFGDMKGAIKNIGGTIKELSTYPNDDSFIDSRAFGAQLGRGTVRFSTGIIGNMAGIGNKIAGSIGSGLAVFSLDDSFRRDRKTLLSRKPSTFGHGLVSGVTQLGKGVISGVSGLVEKPLRGTQKHGIVGGIGGLGKGLAGLVIKPMTGAVDMVQSSFAGLESLANPNSRLVRVRDPRYIDPAGVITPFSWHKSMGQRFITENFDGQYANDGYISHISEELEGGKVRLIMVLQRRVLVLQSQGKNSLLQLKVEKDIDSHRLEGLRMIPGQGIELWYTGSGAVMVLCHDRNVSRLSALLGELIALHQRSRRSRIASSSHCYFPDRSMVNKMTLKVLSTPKKPQFKQAQSSLLDIYENQRYIPWVGFTQRLLPTDRSPWSDGSGSGGVQDLRIIRPSPGFRWIGDWIVDTSSGTDSEGWQYAIDFPSAFVPTYNKMLHFVRRRRWTREQEPIE